MESIQRYAQENNNRQERKIGKSSKVILEVGKEAVELKIRINRGGMWPGIYDVGFSCTSPGTSMISPEALVIGEEGQGESRIKIELEKGVHEGCQVVFGSRLVAFDPIIVEALDKEDQRENRIVQLV